MSVCGGGGVRVLSRDKPLSNYPEIKGKEHVNKSGNQGQNARV